MQTAETLSDYERERGKPAPDAQHSVTQLGLIKALLRFDDEYSILPELSLELHGRHLVPDLSVFPKRTPDWMHDRIRVEEPPLLVIEILSPKQAMQDLMEKFEVYLQAGVRSCWLVQPMLKTIAVFTPEAEPRVYTEGTIRDPTTKIEVALRDVFG